MPKIITDEKLIDEILSRGVENIYPDKDSLKKLLMSGRQIKLYCGFDPTAPTLHIGSGIQIRKLAKFSELGHKVIFLFGDFTAQIGDPDKLSVRQPLTHKQIMENLKNWKKQIKNIIDVDKIEFKFNAKWLARLNFEDLIEIAKNFTVGQMLDRDMFQKRMQWQVMCRHCKNLFSSPIQFGSTEAFESARITGNSTQCPICNKITSLDKEDIVSPGKVYLHEFFYPLMQAYDSVAMDVDLEIGGNDQMFNMLAGRTLMKKMKNREKMVLTTKLLSDPTGLKMGKTEGNMVTLEDAPEDVYGKVMSWTDEMIVSAFEILTDVSVEEVQEMDKQIKAGANPRDMKMKLAYEVVKVYLGEVGAKKAEDNFKRVFQDKEKPLEIAEVKIPTDKLQNGEVGILDLFVTAGLAPSNGEMRRLIKEGAIRIDDRLISQDNLRVTIPEEGLLLQKGKKGFARVVIK